MKIFKGFRKTEQSENERCPLCGRRDIKDSILISLIEPTDGNVMKDVVVHVECLDDQLVYNQRKNMIYADCLFPSQRKP